MKRSALLHCLIALCVIVLVTVPENLRASSLERAASSEAASDRRFANGSSAEAIPLIFSTQGHMFLRAARKQDPRRVIRARQWVRTDGHHVQTSEDTELKTTAPRKFWVGEGEDYFLSRECQV